MPAWYKGMLSSQAVRERLPCLLIDGVCRALKDADANARTQQGELGKINPQLQKVDDNLNKLRQEVQKIEG